MLARRIRRAFVVHGDLNPYAVPVNYVYDGRRLFPRAQLEKYDLARKNPKAPLRREGRFP